MNDSSNNQNHNASGRRREELIRILEARNRFPSETPIAAVGLSGRYPMAENVDVFWDNLIKGRCAVTEVPSERWDWRPWDKETPGYPEKSPRKWGGFLSDVDKFDPLFFQISPEEARHIDPQERLFLETAWACLEDAGYTPRRLAEASGDVGVFVGAMNSNYAILSVSAWTRGRRRVQGNAAFWSIANRVSYSFDFTGPSLAVDSACSSSLTAVHLACESLKRGECGAALAGGVNLILHPSHMENLSYMEMLSPTGRCRSFGEGADGFVDGEGVGAVLLKPLDKAIRDGDHVYGVILATGLNSGGKTGGYTVPNPNAQAGLIEKTLKRAGVKPRSVSYMETHGTGTALGDPIEFRGLVKAFAARPEDGQYCAIGSVKSNIGHLEAAAGISGLTKVLLQMKHKQLVPSLHAERENPRISFKESPFYLQKASAPWEAPRIAGISSFGAGGANAHVLLQAFESPTASENAEEGLTPRLFVFSAKTRERLAAQISRFADFLEAQINNGAPGLFPSEVSHTLLTGREAFRERVAVVARDLQELKDKCRRYMSGGGSVSGVFEGRVERSGAEAETSPEDSSSKDLDAHALSDMARKWVVGKPLDFSRLFSGRRPKRVSLPTYPFAKERCWLDDPETLPSATPGALPTPRRPEPVPDDKPETLFFRPVWEKAPLSEAPVGGGVLLILDAHPQRFQKLKEKWENVETASPLDLKQKEDIARLFSRLEEKDRLPSHILAGSDEDWRTNILFLLNLTQVLIERKMDRRTKTIFVGIGDDGLSGPFNAALGGFLKSALAERPTAALKAVEFSGPGDLTENQADALLAECAAPEGVDVVVHYQGTERRVERLQLEKAVVAEPPIEIKKDGVYLITGGAGGLGRILAEHWSRRGRAKLVLTGRSFLSADKAEWLKRLNKTGNEVVYLRADATREEDVLQLMEKIKSRFGRLDGLVHSAGVLRDAFIFKKTHQDVLDVASAKVEGALNLDRATRGEHLDFFILFSSVSSVIGNAGQCDYAYGNAFMDRFALWRDAERRRGNRFGASLSINWPFWREGGMRIDDGVLKSIEAAAGLLPLSQEEGVSAFENILRAPAPRVTPLYGRADRIKSFIKSRGLWAGSERTTSTTEPGRAPARSAEKALAPTLSKEIRAVIAQLLKIEPERIDTEENIADYGFDSLSLKALARRFKERFNVDLSPAVFFTHNTLAKLTAHMLEDHGEEISKTIPAFEPQRITAAPKESESVIDRPTSFVRDDIAVIGMSGIFPGSRDLEAFWENLLTGKDMVTLIPPERWAWEDYFGDPFGEKNKMNTKWGGFIPNVDCFDHRFFNIPKSEADLMDPQHRIFLQTVWKAIEDGGYRVSDLNRKTVGVFVGVEFSDYADILGSAGRYQPAMAIGNAHSMIPNRVSYLFDFRGPSEAVDTACSSSLVAVHRAVRSLRSGECDAALAGGVSLTLSPRTMLGTCQLGVYSPDGRCKTFDKKANGYVKGEGVGVALLKLLSKARADGDHVHAVIRGSAVNHGGRSNSLTAPNAKSQSDLLVKAYQEAGVSPDRISYLELHGTGTNLGDPVEVEGIKSAFKRLSESSGANKAKPGSCGIGSVKSNIGHLEPASGIAGLIKVILSLREKKLSPNLHFKELNPYIQIEGTPFYVVDQALDWKARFGSDGRALPRVAGVSSFGFGGTNAHVVVEEFNEPARGVLKEEPAVMTISAKNRGRLAAYACELASFIRKRNQGLPRLSDAAYTLQTGREAMEERAAFVVSSWEGCLQKLDALAQDREKIDGVFRGAAGEERGKLAGLLEDDHEFMDLLVRRNDREKIARLWTLGTDIDWRRIHGDNVKRTPLPTYPFEEIRCWVSAPSSEQEALNGRVERPGHEPGETPPVRTEFHIAPSSTFNDHKMKTVILSKLAEMSGRPEKSLGLDLHLEADLAMDSIKIMGLLNELMIVAPSEEVSRLGAGGVANILGRAQTVGDLIDVFGANGSHAETREENHPARSLPSDSSEEGLPVEILHAQSLFLPTHYLIKSNSLCSYVRLKGAFDVETAQLAWNDLVARHPALRTRIYLPKERPATFQNVTCRILPRAGQMRLAVEDLRGLPEGEKEQSIRRAFERHLNREWNLEGWPLHELSLCRIRDDESALFWSNEHIISDGLGNQQALREFLELYRARRAGETSALPPPITDEEYRDLVRTLNNYKDPGEEAAFAEYTRTQGRVNYSWNPEKRAVDPERFRFVNETRILDLETTRLLRARTKDLRCSLNALLVGAYLRIVSRLDPADGPIILQAPTSGKVYPEVDASRVLGCFAQNLSLSFERAAETETLEQTAARVHEAIQKGLLLGYDRTQARQIGRLVKSLPLENGGGLSAATRAMMLAGVKSNLYVPFTGQSGIKDEYGGLRVLEYRAGTINTPGSIDFLQEIFQDQLLVSANFDEAVFSREIIGKLLDGYLRELKELATSPAPKGEKRESPRLDFELKEILPLAQEACRRKISPDDEAKDLEAELGLDSLERIRLITKIYSQRKGQVDRRALFSCRSLREMAAVIGQGIPSSQETLPDIPYLHIVRQAAKTPDAVAVTSADGASITYGELDLRSNQIARALKARGVGRDGLVGLLCRRGPTMLTGLLGILKSGAAYVPIDWKFPADRTNYILRHARIKALLSETALAGRLEDLQSHEGPHTELILLDEEKEGELAALRAAGKWTLTGKASWDALDKGPVPSDGLPTDRMVVLYTSGSTGRPKGVSLNHLGYMNRLVWHQKMFQLKPGEKVAQKTSCCFDVSLWELFWPLMYGGVVCAVENDVVSDPWSFADWLERNDIHIAHFVPSMFGEFVRAVEGEARSFRSLRWLIFSGEALPTPMVQSWIDKFGLRVGLANLYGPTEASIDVTCHVVEKRPADGDRIPIGAPVDNTPILILDENLRPVPKGEMGELCIGGVQVGQGYLFDPELTAKAFVDNPFPELPGDKIYKTGDLACELPDGSFDYRGRKDSQIKIRGFRVELGEIENVLCAHETVKEAAAMAVDEEDGSKRLVAWIAGKKDVDEKTLKDHVAGRCPYYMVPHWIFRLDSLPKNPNGKLDRKVLLKSLQEKQAAPPAEGNENEETLPLAPAQRWIFSYFDPPYKWWGYSRFQFTGRLNPETAAESFQRMIARHPALRTVFVHVDGQWRQKILKKGLEFKPEVVNLRGLEEVSYERRIQKILSAMGESLDVGVWPLFKIAVARRDNGVSEIIWVGHHLISDFISNQILFKEFAEILRGGKPGKAALPPSSVDYVHRLADLEKAELSSDPAAPWEAMFSGKPAFEFPTDHSLGENMESSEGELNFLLAPDLTRRLVVEAKRRFKCPLYPLLLTPLYRLFALKTGDPWVILSHKMTGRDLGDGRLDFFRSAGNFAVNFPVGLSVDPGEEFEETLTKIRNAFQSLPWNGVGYDWAADRLPKELYPDHKLTPVRVNYLGAGEASAPEGFLIRPENNNRRLSPPWQKRTCLLEFFIYQRDGALHLRIAYSKNFHKQRTVRKLGEDYLKQTAAFLDSLDTAPTAR